MLQIYSKRSPAFSRLEAWFLGALHIHAHTHTHTHTHLPLFLSLSLSIPYCHLCLGLIATYSIKPSRIPHSPPYYICISGVWPALFLGYLLSSIYISAFGDIVWVIVQNFSMLFEPESFNLGQRLEVSGPISLSARMKAINLPCTVYSES